MDYLTQIKHILQLLSLRVRLVVKNDSIKAQVSSLILRIALKGQVVKFVCWARSVSLSCCIESWGASIFIGARFRWLSPAGKFPSPSSSASKLYLCFKVVIQFKEVKLVLVAKICNVKYLNVKCIKLN